MQARARASSLSAASSFNFSQLTAAHANMAVINYGNLAEHRPMRREGRKAFVLASERAWRRRRTQARTPPRAACNVCWLLAVACPAAAGSFLRSLAFARSSALAACWRTKHDPRPSSLFVLVHTSTPLFVSPAARATHQKFIRNE